MQMFCKEFVTWKALDHPNVLPLLGVKMAGIQLAMVSEWMVNGNINQFVRANQDTNRFELVRRICGSAILPAIDHHDFRSWETPLGV